MIAIARGPAQLIPYHAMCASRVCLCHERIEVQRQCPRRQLCCQREPARQRIIRPNLFFWRSERVKRWANATSPKPHTVDRRLALRLTCLIHRMNMQQHLNFGCDLIPAQTIRAAGQASIDGFSRHGGQGVGHQLGCGIECQVPACRMRRNKMQLFLREVLIERFGERARLSGGDRQHGAIHQRELIALCLQVHRIGAQPVSGIGRTPVGE